MTRSTYVPVLILVISFFVFFGFFAAADQCTIQAGIYYDVSLVRDCFRSIPFDETIRKDTVKQLRNLIEAYSFTERSKNSGAPFFINVDLQAEIDRMETAPYLCDFDFHADVNEVFNRLGDAHTCYQAPLGYSSFIKLFPFGVVGVSNPDGSFRGLKVNSLVQSQHDDYASATGVELDDYIGETIVRIQGRDALEYVQAVGDRAGISKSDGVRFNFALMANSFKGQIVGSTTGLSTDDYYNIEFDYGEVLKIKILAVSTRSFTSKNDIVQANQFPSLSSFAKTDPELWRRPIASVRKHGPFIDPLKKEHETVRNYVSAPKRDGNETIEREKKHMKQRHGKLSRFISYAPIFEEHELVKPFVSYSSEVQHAENVHIDGTVWSYVAQSFDLSVTCFYSGDANQPLILRIHSFNPPTDELSEAWVKSAVQTIDTCFKFGRDHAIDNLIVDVRCNGGGLICAAIAASQMFNPSEYIIDKDTTSNMYKIMMPYDLKKTATTQKLVDSDLLNADRNDPLTGEKLTDYIWFEDTVWSNMHGVSGEFTAKTYFPGDCVLNFPVQDYVTDPIQPPFKKIIIYTDGMCGSACSLFITKLRYAGIGAIVAKGGRTDTIIESASFSGGNVFEWDDVVASYGEILDFEYFPTSASARFNFNEMYAENQVIPREFMRLDPDYRILNWDFSEDTAINNSRPSYYEYDKVIPFFDDEDFDKKIAGNLLPEFRPPAVDKQGNEHTYRFDGTFCIEETDVSVSRQVVMVQNASAPWSICSSPDNTLCIENDVADSTKVYLIDGNVRRNCAVTWTTNNDRGTLCCGDSLLTSANVISTSDTCSHTLIFSRKHCGGNPAPLNFHVEVLSMQLVVMGWNKSSVGDMLGYVLQYSNSKTFASPAENMVPGDSLKTVLGGFEPNQRYYARLAVNTIAGVGNWSEIVSFSLPLRNPFAVIEGGSQLARAGDVVVFDGGRSYDPNSKTFGNSALLYTWSCTGKCDSYEYVITTANQQNSQKLQITVSSSSASSIESVTINMHVALKTDESIISSISSVLKALPHGSAISPMEIQLIGGVLESSSMISVQQPLRLWCETTGTRNIEWSVLMPDFPMDPFDLASFSSTGIHQSLLLIPGGMLESITYSFTVRDVNAIDANVTRDFTILPEPQIGTIEIEPLVLGDQIPFSSTFRVSVSGWTSYRPLQYAFFVLYDQGGIQMRLPLRGGPSFSTSIETTLPSPTPTDTSEVVILVKAYDDIGGVAWSTKPFTLSPKTSTADETLTLAHNLRTSVDPTKPFPDISEQLTSLILVLENTIENKSSLTTEEIEDLKTLVRNVIDLMLEIVGNHSSDLTNDMLNAMSSGVRAMIEYNDAVMSEGYLDKCLSVLRSIYQLRSSEQIEYSSMQMSALDVSEIIRIGKNVPTFNMSAAQETMREMTMGIAYQMRAGDPWKNVDGDTMFLGIAKMSRTRGLLNQTVTSAASNFGADQPDVTFPVDFQAACDPNNEFGDMIVKVAALSSQMFAANPEKHFGSYQVSISVLNGNGSEIDVSSLQNRIRMRLRKVASVKTGSQECVFFNHISSTWSNEGVATVDEDNMFVTCESEHLSDFATFAIPSDDGDDSRSSGGDDGNGGSWVVVGVVVGGMILIGIVVASIVIIHKKRKNSHRNGHIELENIGESMESALIDDNE